MKLDTGTIIVIGMVLLFYLRLIVIQWGKADRYNRAKKDDKKSTPQNYASLKFNFNWLLIGIGAALIILASIMKGTGIFGQWLEQNWWIFASTGVFVFGMGIRK
jgi:hypothetical protein